ncbi:hypothetical protein [Kitasatospora griseola]|uniref:hypothetical protein n=1 Tax=Kitasatospora griseola TaxID=2064 RepID=UPI003664972F
MFDTQTAFAAFFGSATVTSGMVLVAEALTGRADRRRAARRTTAVVRTTAMPVAAAVEPERADV